MYRSNRHNKGMIAAFVLLVCGFAPGSWANAQLDNPFVDFTANVGLPAPSPDTEIDLLSVFSDSLGSDLTFTVVSNTDSSVVSTNFESSGDTLVLTPVSAGTAAIVIGATGDTGPQITDAITVTVVDNAAPVASPTTQAPVFIEDDPVPITADLDPGIFTDPDGDPLTLSPGPVTGDLILTAGDLSSGTVTMTPIPDANGTQQFVFIATDTWGASTTFTVSFTLTPVNDAPTAGAIADTSVPEDTVTVSVSIGGVFDDVDLANEGDSHTVTAVSDNPALVFSTNSLASLAGSLTFDVTPDASGTAGITVTATDFEGLSVQTTFNITVTPVNDTPTAGVIADRSVPEDTVSVSVSINGIFIDVDAGDAHTVTALSDDPALVASTNSLSGLTGDLTFSVTPDANGTAGITVTATDLSGASVQTSFTIEVTPVNDAPTAGAIADTSVPEDTVTVSVSIGGVFDDVDLANEGDSHTVTAVSDNPALVFSTNSLASLAGSLTFDVTPDASGTAGITVTATDFAGFSVQASFTVTVTPVDDPPTAGSIPDTTVPEDTGSVSVSINGVFDDADLPSDSHTVTAVSANPALMTSTNSLASLNGDLTFAVAPNGNGDAGITVTATDSTGLSIQTSFTITVTPSNDPPILVGNIPDQVHPEDGGVLSVSFAGVFDDVDLANEGDTQNFSVLAIGNPTLITAASISGTSVLLTFGAEQNGSSTVEILVQDSAGAGVSDSFVVDVTPVDDPPFVQNPIGVIEVLEDSVDTVIDLYDVFDDPDIATNGDVLTFVIISNDNPTLFALISITGGAGAASLVLDYGDNQFGTANLVVEATDSAGLTASDAFTVNVTEVAPVAADESVSMNEDDPALTINVLANDDLGEEPTLIINVGRTWVDPVSGSTYTEVSESGPTTIVDGAGIEVTEPNGTLAIVGGMITYTPKENYFGTDRFFYTIQDQDGDTSTAEVTVTVIAQADAPRSISDPEYTVLQGSFLNILAAGGLLTFAYDDDGDPLEVRLESEPTHAVTPNGFVLDASGSFMYIPEPTYGNNPGEETDTFEIVYFDNNDGLSSPVITVTINIDPEEAAVAVAPPGEVEFGFNLADVPLEDAVAAEANVLIMMDDSGSMDWSLMTPENEGQFYISNSNTKNNGVSSYTNYYRYVNQFATNLYTGNRNVPTEETLDADSDFDGNDYGVWRARSSAYSTIYYNPEIRYWPWIGLDRNGLEFADVDETAAPLDPFDVSVQTIDLTAPLTYTSRRVPAITQYRKTITNSNIYLPYYYTTSATGVPVWNDPHTKVEIRSGGTYTGGADRSDCAVADDDPFTCTYGQEIRNFANWFSYYRSREYTAKAALGRSVSSASNIRMGYAVLNDANERERIDSLNASYRVGHKKDMMDQVYKIRSFGRTPLRSALDKAGRHFECVSGDAFGSTSDSSPGDPACPVLASPEGQCQNNFTLLFSDGTWNQTFSGVGAANQDNDTAGPDPSPSAFDGGMFEDTVTATLADIAMYYYERDLHSLENGVPTTQRDQDWAPVSAFENDGEVMHQHMKTYTIGFGLDSNIQFSDLPLDYTQPFAWGNPFNQGLEKVDDMLHAAVNGRGEFLQANNPVLLSQAFEVAFEEFSDGSVSVSAVAFSSTALRVETVEYRGFFNLKFHSGDLRALSVDATNGTVDHANPLWRASIQMDNISPSNRNIVTWDNLTRDGIEFEFADLNADQAAMLDFDQVQWLRGLRTEEEPNGILRAREDVEGLLGDIVHSAPQFVGPPRAFRRDQLPYPVDSGDLYSAFANDKSGRQRIVYVAANDGMLHAFDAGDDADHVGTGNEVFAYVPNKIIDSSQRFANDLDQLTSLVYAHRFFVDLTPTVEDVFMRSSNSVATPSWNTVLMGGLGGGGKGYFLLNVTDPDGDFSSQLNATDTVLWEFTDEDDTYPVDASGDPLVDGGGNPLVDLLGDPVKDLGYAFSQPQLVMTNVTGSGGEKKWMAIFGNGYNSSAGIAKLFILDIDAGMDGWTASDIIKLDTGEGVKAVPDPLAGLPNALSTPAVIDEDSNGTGDLAFAGDLFGNLYRFDISDSNPNNWSVTKIFQATYGETLATRQPITTKPFVFKHPNGSGFIIVFGTGSYVTDEDGISTDIQSVYGIWDRGEVNPATARSDAKSTRLVEQRIINIVDETNSLFERQRIVTANDVSYVPDDNSGTAGVYGWYIDLDMVRATTTQSGNPNTDTNGQAPPDPQFPGERAIRRFIARGDTLLITTIIPRDANTCFRAPPGATQPINMLTGGNPLRAILDINNDGYVDDADMITYNGEQYASGILFDTDDLDGTLVDPSMLVGSGSDDFLFLSGGDDQITLRIAGPLASKTGRLSWRELSEAN